ncbi:MAG: bifunctional diaminohydroxyphosphoribosylaminopyrimidine deaminase/5-amino-6-(5-phosphoribosylamino)uracil reductase RibD [Acidobacteriota bacterium]
MDIVEADKTLMKRALELAQRGAGMVSPNPMVGAVLVKDGRIVGEGYHRYDLLKHGETYAIEMAGKQARGSTLYCNLEPCCHLGRTPPCTDALIEAGIARAVIATKDPFSRVSGRGLEQLRAAGIEVEVGLCEEEALRLNETYFKFVTVDTPFIHGVIEYPGDELGSLRGWMPSRGFIAAAAEYDAIVLSSRTELNSLLIDNRLGGQHHRPPVIVGTADLLARYDAIKRETDEDLTLINLSLASSEILRDAGKPAGVFEEASNAPVNRLSGAQRELGSLLEALARISVTSVLLLPGVIDPSAPKSFEQLDKLTLAVPGSKGKDATATRLAFADLEFDLEEVSVAEAEGYTEFTGYPSFREVA